MKNRIHFEELRSYAPLQSNCTVTSARKAAFCGNLGDSVFAEIESLTENGTLIEFVSLTLIVRSDGGGGYSISKPTIEKVEPPLTLLRRS